MLCGDDGLGVAAVSFLRRLYEWPEDVRILDGGTLGLSLMSHIQGTDDVIMVDAISGEGPPGSLVRVEGDQVAPAVRSRLTVHQIGVADLLDGLRLLDAFPRRLVLLGLVPESIELCLGCSESVARNLPQLVAKIVDEAGRMGYQLTPRQRDETALSSDTGAYFQPLDL